MAKCPICGGTGKVVHPMMSMNGDEYTGEWEQHECEACNGTGEVELTNEENIRSCSFEELAGEIYGWYLAGYTASRVGLPLNSITEIVGWLKEKHG